MIYSVELPKIPGSTYYVATCAYVSVQSWGTHISAVADIFTNPADADKWLDNRRQTHSVIRDSITEICIECSHSEILNNCLQSLRAEKTHMREQMQKELEELDDRIENLLAITHQPTQAEEGTLYEHEEDPRDSDLYENRAPDEPLS